MQELIVANQICANCESNLLGTENYCADCGTGVNADRNELVIDAQIVNAEPNTIPAIRQPPNIQVFVQRESQFDRILGNRLHVFGILLMTGPIGLPALWFSPRFSKTAKILLTIALLLVTVVLPLAVAWYYMDIVIRPVADALAK